MLETSFAQKQIALSHAAPCSRDDALAAAGRGRAATRPRLHDAGQRGGWAAWDQANVCWHKEDG